MWAMRYGTNELMPKASESPLVEKWPSVMGYFPGWWVEHELRHRLAARQLPHPSPRSVWLSDQLQMRTAESTMSPPKAVHAKVPCQRNGQGGPYIDLGSGTVPLPRKPRGFYIA